MTFCPSCGALKKEGSKFCHNCGYDFENVDDGANQNVDSAAQLNQNADSTVQLNQNADVNTQFNQNPSSGVQNQNSHTIAKVLGYICAIFMPLFGVIFGGYLYTREEADAKKHGKYILILSAIIWVLSILAMNS